ncbi:MAG: MMPL family transporter [Proteobacteria bacterium]|nr:MMPL family transporter [Pseudomonadota bacterium]
MKNLLNRLSLYFETVPDRLRSKKLIVLLLFILGTAFFFYGLVYKYKMDMTLESWFDESDPIKVAMDKFHAEFGSDDGIFLVYKPADGNVFSSKSLQVVQGIRDDLLNFRLTHEDPSKSMLNHITRINSLVNAPVLKVEGDSLVSKQLVGVHIPTNLEELEQIRRTALSQKDFPLLYFSKDFKYGGLFIETDFGTIPVNQSEDENEEFDELGFGENLEVDDNIMAVDETATAESIKFKSTEWNEYIDLMKEIKAVINKEEYADHLTYYPVGNAPLMDYGMELMAQMPVLYITMLLVIVVLLWFLFRSFSAVSWPITIIVLSAVWTVGITFWLGVTITTMVGLTVMLILAVGTADAIHILSGYMFFRKENKNHETAMRLAYRKSAIACFLTTFTTAVGMFSLTFTQIEHIKTFGFMSGLGVIMAFFFTLYLLPLLMDFWPPVVNPERRPSKFAILRWIGQVINNFGRILSQIGKYIPDFTVYLQKLLDGVLPLVKKNPYAYTAVFLSIFGACMYGATQVKVDSNIIEQFKEGTAIRNVYEVVDEHMMGTQNMVILMEMGSPNAFHDPFVLKSMDRLQQTIASKYNHLVVRTNSLADVVKDAYQTLNEDRPEMYVIPDNSRMLSQTLFMFNNANPEDRRKLVSDDYSKSHVSVQLYNAGSFEYIKMFKEMRQDIDKTMNQLKTDYPDMKVTITGGLALIMELSDYISWSQIKSLSMVIVVISIILIFVFGSVRAGLISIIPNLIPATVTFGLLGLLGMPLDSDTMVIAPVIIGVAVDDTIHFITHYRGEVLLDGDIERALRNTIKEVGQAITFTTLILGLGFSIMMFSSHMGTSNMGKFGSLAIFAALICDLLMLPAMILIFKPRFAKQASVQPAA